MTDTEVLVLRDEATSLRFVLRNLIARRLRVQTAQQSAEDWRLLDNTDEDVVLVFLDVKTADMCGLEVPMRGNQATSRHTRPSSWSPDLHHRSASQALRMALTTILQAF
jgi:response regulator RpfG family c-di-GMP phosphodiesterase